MPKCRECAGTGRVGEYLCTKCGGDGEECVGLHPYSMRRAMARPKISSGAPPTVSLSRSTFRDRAHKFLEPTLAIQSPESTRANLDVGWDLGDDGIEVSLVCTSSLGGSYLSA